jgi:hypothetical protein
MAHSGLTGDESAAIDHREGLAGGLGAGEYLLRQPVRPGKTRQTFDAAKGRLLCGSVGDWNAVTPYPAEDFIEGVVVVELPPDRDHVLGGSALQQETTRVVVEPKSDGIGQRLVKVHPDGIATEPAPVVELVGLDHDVAEVYLPEY